MKITALLTILLLASTCLVAPARVQAADEVVITIPAGSRYKIEPITGLEGTRDARNRWTGRVKVTFTFLTPPYDTVAADTKGQLIQRVRGKDLNTRQPRTTKRIEIVKGQKVEEDPTNRETIGVLLKTSEKRYTIPVDLYNSLRRKVPYSIQNNLRDAVIKPKGSGEISTSNVQIADPDAVFSYRDSLWNAQKARRLSWIGQDSIDFSDVQGIFNNKNIS